jgi:SAM-dependent methyltransferase
MKLNLGCGQHHPEGWVNADINSERNPDVLLVRGEALPWEDNTFDQIQLFLVLNHVPLNEMDGFLSEVERVLSPEGRLLVLDEHYPDGTPDYKKDGVADGPLGNAWDFDVRTWIDAWLCHAGSLNKLLHPFFPHIETLWENAGEEKPVLFTDQHFSEGGFLDWIDSDGRTWPIKGLGLSSCLMIAATE